MSLQETLLKLSSLVTPLKEADKARDGANDVLDVILKAKLQEEMHELEQNEGKFES